MSKITENVSKLDIYLKVYAGTRNLIEGRRLVSNWWLVSHHVLCIHHEWDSMHESNMPPFLRFEMKYFTCFWGSSKVNTNMATRWRGALSTKKRIYLLIILFWINVYLLGTFVTNVSETSWIWKWICPVLAWNRNLWDLF